MRIGINSLFMIPGEVGGTETYLRELLSCMARDEIAADDEIVVFTNAENDALFRAVLKDCSRVTFSPLPFRAAHRPHRIIREQLQLPGRAHQAGVDVLWSPGYTAPLFSSCPQVVTIHDMQYKRFPRDLTFGARIATDFLVRQACKRCERIIAVSEFSKRELLKYTSAPADRIRAIHEGVNPAFLTPPGKIKNPCVNEVVNLGRPYILCVSNTYVHKNIPLLIKAFGALTSEIPHALVLVGSPGLGEREVIRSIEKVGGGRIVRLSRLDINELGSLYQGAEVFVLPSLYEGFGLPVLEAMMAGVPVITTREGSISELGGDYVDYFEPASETDLCTKIRAALDMPAQTRKTRVEQARNHARTFTWEKAAARTLECLKDAAAEANAGRSKSE